MPVNAGSTVTVPVHQRHETKDLCGSRNSGFAAAGRMLPRESAHHLHRATFVHREAYQLTRRIKYFPEPAVAPDRVAGLGGDAGSLGLALLGHRSLRSS